MTQTYVLFRYRYPLIQIVRVLGHKSFQLFYFVDICDRITNVYVSCGMSAGIVSTHVVTPCPFVFICHIFPPDWYRRKKKVSMTFIFEFNNWRFRSHFTVYQLYVCILVHAFPGWFKCKRTGDDRSETVERFSFIFNSSMSSVIVTHIIYYLS